MNFVLAGAGFYCGPVQGLVVVQYVMGPVCHCGCYFDFRCFDTYVLLVIIRLILPVCYHL